MRGNFLEIPEMRESLTGFFFFLKESMRNPTLEQPMSWFSSSFFDHCRRRNCTAVMHTHAEAERNGDGVSCPPAQRNKNACSSPAAHGMDFTQFSFEFCEWKTCERSPSLQSFGMWRFVWMNSKMPPRTSKKLFFWCQLTVWTPLHCLYAFDLWNEHNFLHACRVVYEINVLRSALSSCVHALVVWFALHDWQCPKCPKIVVQQSETRAK